MTVMKWLKQCFDRPTPAKLILCPFHDEKTPSCHVDLLRGRFHCFGCGRIGAIADLPEGSL